MNSKEDWKELESELKEAWRRVLRGSPITWVERNCFWIIYESIYSPASGFLSRAISLPCSMDVMRARVPIPPVFTPCEEGFPGPVERWYGIVDNHLFTVTHHYGGDGTMTILRSEDDSTIAETIASKFDEFIHLQPA